MPCTYFEDMKAIYIEEVRRMLGGRRKLAAAHQVLLALQDGRQVRVALAHRPGTLGGEITLFACPECGRPSLVLRVTKEGAGLACVRCLQGRSVKYRSQILGSPRACPQALQLAD